MALDVGSRMGLGLLRRIRRGKPLRHLLPALTLALPPDVLQSSDGAVWIEVGDERRRRGLRVLLLAALVLLLAVPARLLEGTPASVSLALLDAGDLGGDLLASEGLRLEAATLVCGRLLLLELRLLLELGLLVLVHGLLLLLLVLGLAELLLLLLLRVGAPAAGEGGVLAHVGEAAGGGLDGGLGRSRSEGVVGTVRQRARSPLG